MKAQTLQVVDSHTGGEPTRLIVDGAPDAPGSMAEILDTWRQEHDHLRSATVNEPRGSDGLVGGAIYPPADPVNTCGVLFFNNVGYLGMCGHGTMGLVATLAHLGRIQSGHHRIETPVGLVEATLADTGEVTLRNVAAYRLIRRQPVRLSNGREVTGDIAWGGNWFFLCEDHGEHLEASLAESLVDVCREIRRTLAAQGVRGRNGAEIDHIELTGPGTPGVSDSRSFVLCPGDAYDRSPCGTGTSAKLACLIEEGRLAPGETWRQESLTGSVFTVRGEWVDGALVPILTGRAYITAESTLFLDPLDPFCWGLPIDQPRP